MELSKDIREKIIKHCVAEVPHQACGLVLFNEGMHSVDSVETINYGAWPYGFQISPNDMLNAAMNAKKRGLQVRGIYHSHLASDAQITDRDKARLISDDLLYIIVSVLDVNNPEICCYHKINDTYIMID